MRVLLLEDDVVLARRMARQLRKVGLAVDPVEWLEDAAVRVGEHDYDCLILDRVVPGGDALELLAKIRASGSSVPVMVVSGRHVSATDRVEALRSGADDCLAKPFALEELCSRVQCLCRRAGQVAGTLLEVADLTMDTARLVAHRGGRQLTLNAKELALLEVLLRRAGEVVSRKELWEHCWGEREESYSNTVDVHICRLRRALGEPGLIRTVRGIGYSVAPQ